MDRVENTTETGRAHQTPSMRRKPTLREGWAATPTPVRMGLAGLGLVNVAVLAYLLLSQGPIHVGVLALGITIGIITTVAIVGTVLDIYASPADVRGQKWRSLAIGICLLAMVGMFFAATIVRMGANVMNRPY